MHWILLLALLSSTTGLKNTDSPSTLNRLAENALRRQIGDARSVKVQVSPSRDKGGFDNFSVSLDGFAADRLLDLANRTDQSSRRNDPYSGGQPDGRSPDEPRYPSELRRFKAGDLGDIFGGIGGGKYGDLGGIFGDILGGGLGTRGVGRVGHISLRATNFSFQGARYDFLSADLGEVRFDWSKALRGEMDVQSVAPGSLALRLSSSQMTRLLAPRLPSLRDVKVQFSGGRAFVGAKSEYYGVRVPFEVGARLSVQNNEVRADDFRASIAKLRLPGLVTDELTRGLNPLYDFDPQNRWPLAINLSTAQAQGDTLALQGGIRWIGFNSRHS